MLLSRLAFGSARPKRNLWKMKMCNLTLFLEMLKGKMDTCILSIECSPFSSCCIRMYKIVSQISRVRMTNVEHSSLGHHGCSVITASNQSLRTSQPFSQSAKYVNYLILFMRDLFPFKKMLFFLTFSCNQHFFLKEFNLN